MEELLTLFLTFLQVGAMSFGGGYSILRLISYYVVEQHGWITMQDFKEIVAISNSTPGPIGINAATFVGFKVAGFAGAVVATLGTILVPFALSVAVAGTLVSLTGSGRFKKIIRRMKPVTLAMVAAAALNFLSPSVLTVEGTITTALSLAGMYFLKLDPAVVIVLFGLIGLIAT